MPVTDEGQGVEDAFGEDDFAAGVRAIEAAALKTPAERPGKVEVAVFLRRLRIDAAAVELDDVAALVR